MTPDQAQNIYYAKYRDGMQEDGILNQPVVQKKIVDAAWQEVIDAIRKEVVDDLLSGKWEKPSG